MPDNERAKLLAREAHLRAHANGGTTQKPVVPPKLQIKEYADSRRKVRVLHKKFPRQQQTTIRMTQTLLTPDTCSKVAQALPCQCMEACHVLINQEHMLWLCPKVDRSSIRREWLTQPATLEQQLSLASFVRKTIGTPRLPGKTPGRPTNEEIQWSFGMRRPQPKGQIIFPSLSLSLSEGAQSCKGGDEGGGSPKSIPRPRMGAAWRWGAAAAGAEAAPP